jgi:Zn-dependent M28 family amino/carboxypeptidase
VGPAHEKIFQRLKSSGRETFEDKAPVVFVLTNENPANYHFEIKSDITSSSLANVVGVLPGKSKKDEYVIFSAHYDHLGVGKPDATGDSIYNGANDDAAGTTAVIMLADYFSKLNNNERTLIFVTFTAEEIGGFGSQYFSKQIDPEKAVAMFNIEMIGTDSKWGNNSAYITGYERSDFGKILQSNLAGSKFHFEPDPYPKQNLFYRSDNATLAALGVPAHTISTSKMDNEPNYHKPSDEISTLDMKNMAEIIKAIAISSQTIISGKDTPSRVEKRD